MTNFLTDQLEEEMDAQVKKAREFLLGLVQTEGNLFFFDKLPLEIRLAVYGGFEEEIQERSKRKRKRKLSEPQALRLKAYELLKTNLARELYFEIKWLYRREFEVDRAAWDYHKDKTDESNKRKFDEAQEDVKETKELISKYPISVQKAALGLLSDDFLQASAILHNQTVRIADMEEQNRRLKSDALKI